MAKPKNSKIEQCLRRIVREAVTAKDETITVRKARSRAEHELKLGDGFFKDDEQWNQRSRTIIQAAFDEPEALKSAPTTVTSSSRTADTPTPASKHVKASTKAQQSSNGVAASSEEAKPPVTKAGKAPLVKSRNEVVEDRSSSSSSSSDSSGSSEAKEEESQIRSRTEATKRSTPNKTEKIVAQVNGVKRKAEELSTTGEDSSPGEDSSDQIDEEADERSQKKPKTASQPRSENLSKVNANVAIESEGNEAETVLPAIPLKLFKPPQGFTAVDTELLSNNADFTQASMEGKQLWHLVAPSNVSLSSINEVGLDAIQSNQPILTYNGIEYILNEDNDQASNGTALMIPTANGYERAEQKIQRRLQLQQKITLPNLSVRQASQVTGSSAAADMAQASVSSIRPQPKNLRMRYKPPGFGSGKPGKIGSGSESTDEEQQTTNRPTFQFPKTLGGDATSAQRDGDVAVFDGANVERTSKKPKKKRKEKHPDENAAPKVNGVARPNSSSSVQGQHNDTTSDPHISKTVPMQPAEQTMPENQGSTPNGVSKESMSKEERRKLKRERKEAKRKAKGETPAN